MTQLRTIVPWPPSQQLDDEGPSSSSSSVAMAITKTDRASTSPMKAKSLGSKATGGGGGGTATTTEMCVDDLVMGHGRADTGLRIVRPRAIAASAAGRRKGNAAGPSKLPRPRLPMSGYNLFLRDERRRGQHDGSPEGRTAGRAAAAEAKAAINARWRQLDRHTRDSYNKRGRDEMARYKDEMEIYNRVAVHRDGDEDQEDCRPELKKPKRQTLGGTGKNQGMHSAFQFVSTASGAGDGDAELALASYASLAERAEENERRIRENEAALAALARKEDFVVFLRLLTKYLRLVDPDLHARARRVVRECVESYKREYSGGAKGLGDRHSPATLSLNVYDMADKLRDAVGLKHFARAEAMANAWSYHRGSQ